MSALAGQQAPKDVEAGVKQNSRGILFWCDLGKAERSWMAVGYVREGVNSPRGAWVRPPPTAGRRLRSRGGRARQPRSTGGGCRSHPSRWGGSAAPGGLGSCSQGGSQVQRGRIVGSCPQRLRIGVQWWDPWTLRSRPEGGSCTCARLGSEWC